jgi:hypothetical protein
MIETCTKCKHFEPRENGPVIMGYCPVKFMFIWREYVCEKFEKTKLRKRK